MKVNVKENCQCVEVCNLCKGNWYIRDDDKRIGVIVENPYQDFPYQDTLEIEVVEFLFDGSETSDTIYHGFLSKFMFVTPCKVEMDVIKCKLKDVD